MSKSASGSSWAPDVVTAGPGFVVWHAILYH
jgi:hypothetical protein